MLEELVIAMALSSLTFGDELVCNGSVYLFKDYSSQVKMFQYAEEFFGKWASEERFWHGVINSQDTCFSDELHSKVSGSTSDIIVVLLTDRILDPCRFKNARASTIQLIKTLATVNAALHIAQEKPFIMKFDPNKTKEDTFKALRMVINSAKYKTGCRFPGTKYAGRDLIEFKSAKKERVFVPMWFIVIVGAVAFVTFAGVVAVLVVQSRIIKGHYNVVVDRLKQQYPDTLKDSVKSPPLNKTVKPVSINEVVKSASKDDSVSAAAEAIPRASKRKRVFVSCDKAVGKDDLSDYFNDLADFCVKYVAKRQNVNKSVGNIKSNLKFIMREHPTDLDMILKESGQLILPLLHQGNRLFDFSSVGPRNFEDVTAEALCDALEALGRISDENGEFTDVESLIIDWFEEALGIRNAHWFDNGSRVILDSSFEALITALIASRHAAFSSSGFLGNQNAFFQTLVAYCSHEANSYFEKACQFGHICRIIPADEHSGFDREQLVKEIKKDISEGLRPFFVYVATFSLDQISAIGQICKKYNLWLHADGGSIANLLIFDQNRELLSDMRYVDSLSIDTTKIIRSSSATFLWTKHAGVIEAVLPDIISFRSLYFAQETGQKQDEVRFKALKAFVVMMLAGLNKYRNQSKKMVEMMGKMRKYILSDGQFEVIDNGEPDILCFRIKGANVNDSNEATRRLSAFINKSGVILITGADFGNLYVIRMSFTREHSDAKEIDMAWVLLKATVDNWKNERGNESVEDRGHVLGSGVTALIEETVEPRTMVVSKDSVKRGTTAVAKSFIEQKATAKAQDLNPAKSRTTFAVKDSASSPYLSDTSSGWDHEDDEPLQVSSFKDSDRDNSSSYKTIPIERAPAKPSVEFRRTSRHN